MEITKGKQNKAPEIKAKTIYTYLRVLRKSYVRRARINDQTRVLYKSRLM